MGRCNQIYNVGQTWDKLISGFSDFSAVIRTRVDSTNGIVLVQFFQNILWDLYSYTKGKKKCFHHLFLHLEKNIVWKMPILRLFLPIEVAYYYQIFFHQAIKWWSILFFPCSQVLFPVAKNNKYCQVLNPVVFQNKFFTALQNHYTNNTHFLLCII